MTVEKLIAKYQDRSAEYTRRAAPYIDKQEQIARAWLGRSLECDEIVRDLQALRETNNAVQRVPAKARGNRRDSEASRAEAEGAEGVGGTGAEGSEAEA